MSNGLSLNFTSRTRSDIVIYPVTVFALSLANIISSPLWCWFPPESTIPSSSDKVLHKIYHYQTPTFPSLIAQGREPVRQLTLTREPWTSMCCDTTIQTDGHGQANINGWHQQHQEWTQMFSIKLFIVSSFNEHQRINHSSQHASLCSNENTETMKMMMMKPMLAKWMYLPGDCRWKHKLTSGQGSVTGGKLGRSGFSPGLDEDLTMDSLVVASAM